MQYFQALKAGQKRVEASGEQTALTQVYKTNQAIKTNRNEHVKQTKHKIQTQEHKILPMGVSIAGRIWRRS